MSLKSLEISGFKSFAKKGELSFNSPVTAVVGPNGSGKSNVAESFRFVLGEQSIKSLRGKKTEDLIWNGSDMLPRQSRASVKLVFDNSPKGGKRLLNMDFDEVSIERVIHRDSLSEYLINGTQVRLKDVIELLAGAHIGASGHHIISQGEADRILNSNPKERREMIMDALGLKIYQYKREESERKLEKTRENMKQVESLRREIAPHLKFLKKQVEKVEKTLEMRDALRELYKQYLSRETAYLAHEEKIIADEISVPKDRLGILEADLDQAKKTIESARKEDVFSRELVDVEKRLRHAREKKDEAARVLGRIEGETAALKRALEKARAAANASDRAVPFAEVKRFLDGFSDEMAAVSGSEDISRIRGFFKKAALRIQDFLSSAKGVSADQSGNIEAEIAMLASKADDLQKEFIASENTEKTAEKEYQAIKEKIEKEKDSSRDAEREMFRIMAEQNELRGVLSMLSLREERVRSEKEGLKRDIEEGALILGRDVYLYESHHAAHDASSEARIEQQNRRKEIEKIKVRLEDSGAVSAEEVMKEYEETSTRDQFLAKELVDLETSAVSLESLIAELEGKLETLFTDGIEKINTQFKEFFILMFSGGAAGLRVTEEKKRKRAALVETEDGEALEIGESDEEQETETGVEIDISLPRKKVKSLEMLSGGERALTSIALIFALSQVNPPPFLVLDETDAALDEANSKRYGDMIETLSKHSQLIVITHNRETMSRAGVLYGVTMGKDGASKLLSIEFTEAVAVAK
jgi:chromosome segregation ATPase